MKVPGMSPCGVLVRGAVGSPSAFFNREVTEADLSVDWTKWMEGREKPEVPELATGWLLASDGVVARIGETWRR